MANVKWSLRAHFKSYSGFGCKCTWCVNWLRWWSKNLDVCLTAFPLPVPLTTWPTQTILQHRFWGEQAKTNFLLSKPANALTAINLFEMTGNRSQKLEALGFQCGHNCSHRTKINSRQGPTYGLKGACQSAELLAWMEKKPHNSCYIRHSISNS